VWRAAPPPTLLHKDRACAREVGTSRGPIDRVEIHGARAEFDGAHPARH